MSEWVSVDQHLRCGLPPRARKLARMRGRGPRASERRAAHSLLHRYSQSRPPPSRPGGGGCGSQCRRGPLGSHARQVSDELLSCFIPAPAEHEEPLRASGAELWVGSLRRSATRSMAPSSCTVPGCGWPFRVSGDTRVASQHKAPSRGDAPQMTKSKRRLSSGATPGAVVAQSHCCGAAAGPPSHRPQQLRAQLSPTPVRRSWLVEPRAQCEGRPRHGRRRRARRIREKGRTDLNGGGAGGADGGASTSQRGSGNVIAPLRHRIQAGEN